MATPIEITIKVSDAHQTLRKKHLVYDIPFQFDKDDPTLKPLIEQAVKDFVGTPDEVYVIAKAEV